MIVSTATNDKAQEEKDKAIPNNFRAVIEYVLSQIIR